MTHILDNLGPLARHLGADLWQWAVTSLIQLGAIWTQGG